MIQIGEFVSYKDWRIWVEYKWLDFNYPTLEKMAQRIFQSGWCKELFTLNLGA